MDNDLNLWSLLDRFLCFCHLLLFVFGCIGLHNTFVSFWRRDETCGGGGFDPSRIWTMFK